MPCGRMRYFCTYIWVDNCRGKSHSPDIIYLVKNMAKLTVYRQLRHTRV